MIETYEAFDNKHFLETVDGILDTIYILGGTLAEFGISFYSLEELKVLDEMTKSSIIEEYWSEKTELDEIYEISDKLMDKVVIFINVMFLYKRFKMFDRFRLLMSSAIEVFETCLNMLEQIGISKEHSKDLFMIVHAANMRKVGENGKVIKREDGKILKPEGWYGPEKDLLKKIEETKQD